MSNRSVLNETLRWKTKNIQMAVCFGAIDAIKHVAIAAHFIASASTDSERKQFTFNFKK